MVRDGTFRAASLGALTLILSLVHTSKPAYRLDAQLLTPGEQEGRQAAVLTGRFKKQV